MINSEEEVIGKFKELEFHVSRSRRYHMYRQNFYETLDKIQKIIFLISLSIMGVLTWDGVNSNFLFCLSIFMTLIAILNFVLDFSYQAKTHQDLKKRFIDMNANIFTIDKTSKNLSEINKEIFLIEKDEPPIYRGLNDICQNEQAIAIGSKARLPIPWHVRYFTKNLFLQPPFFQ